MLILAASTRLLESARLFKNNSPPETAESAARRLLDLGFERFALHDGFLETDWEVLKHFFPPGAIVAAALFAPVPVTASRQPAAMPRLGSLDADERREAIKCGRRGIELADRSGIPWILVPPAGLDEPPREDILAVFERSARRAAPEQIQKDLAARWERLRARRAASPEAVRQLESWKGTIYRLLEHAGRYNVRLGLLPAGFPDELPDPAELEAACNEFRGAPLGLFGDAVSGERSRASSGPTPEDFLSRFGERLEGLVVHDGTAAAAHLPPGAGQVDLKRWRGEIWNGERERLAILDFQAAALDDSLIALRREIETSLLPEVKAPPRRSAFLDLPG